MAYNENKFAGGPPGPGGRRKSVEKPKNMKKTLKKLFQYLGKYKIMIFIAIIFSILSVICDIIGPKVLGDATTIIYEGVMNIIADNGLGIDFAGILNIVIILIVLYLLSAGFWYIEGFILTKVTMNVTYNLRKDISKKINRLPLKYFDKKNHGEVLSYITNDVDTISQSLGQSISQIVSSITTLIGIVVMMLTISWKMTIFAFLVLPVSAFLVSIVVRKSQRYFKQQQEYLGHVNGHIEEMYANHTIVKSFNGEKSSEEKFSEYNSQLYKSAWKSQFLSSLMHPIMNFVGNLGYVVICILGGYYATNGIITVGNIQSFIQYMRRFNEPISQIANISNILQSTIAAAERVFEFLAEEEEIPDTDKPASIDNVKGNIEFKNVHFGYNEDKIIINDFSAKVNDGETIAIVGPTGAGKTTIVKLLMRYYDVNSGEILLDGVNIKNFTRNDLRSEFGMVLQDTWTFNGTIMDNIRYGKLDATDEEVIEAAKKAQVDHFVKTLPDGYNMILNEESNNISQGQKQLLTIARAFLSDPKILILDEATSSVDTRTEILIQKTMNNLMKGRTSFIIAHRLSTIKDADKILVMNDGDIIEQGTHEELLDKKGFYYNLYNSQFEKKVS